MAYSTKPEEMVFQPIQLEEENGLVKDNKKTNKRLSVERIYQKKTQLEHILLRPDTYVGSVEPVTQDTPCWVLLVMLCWLSQSWFLLLSLLVSLSCSLLQPLTSVLYLVMSLFFIHVPLGVDSWMHISASVYPPFKFSTLYTPWIHTSSDPTYWLVLVLPERNMYLKSAGPYIELTNEIECSTRLLAVSLDHCSSFMVGLKSNAGLFLKKEGVHALKCEKSAQNLRSKPYTKINVEKILGTTLKVLAIMVTWSPRFVKAWGGRHVDYVADQIVNKLVEVVKKKNKGGIQVKPFQIKNHMWIFVNCLIENPTFDSQTKENMTLQVKSFGSKCQPSEKFLNQVMKCGIVESIMTWVRFKAQTQLNTKCSAKKHSKLKGIPKLEDANDAGTKNSIDCTLILTEGDSAKSLAVSGLSVIGRDKYGVFPLRGKMLNVREATHKQILENAEINNIIKIMGLQYKKKYQSVEDLRTLRYGRLMIMTDQDQDGSHIKGLLINFIHHNWPSLLHLPFLEQFITPIVKAVKGKEEKSFYSLPEFEEWKTQTSNWNTWKIKYYKGLGTSTAKEAREYFADMARHRIKFKYEGSDDDSAIQLAFSKKMVEQRKEWLTNGMEERKHRRELGLPELYVYGKATSHLTFNDFINKELILFSNMDNERSIPSLVDGLKPGQRKVIFTCFKRNDKHEIKVAQLAGSVAELSAYHHGENSLMATIINLAQNFVGSNNINLLQPIGQFGTRLQGGKDSASPRYIFTMLSPLAKHIFPSVDEPLLNHLYEDNQKIEPEFYVPIIPMILVNGTEGIGTGWSTKIPNYNPREIVENLRRMIVGEEPKPLRPWFKNFCGSIEQLDSQRFVISGEIALLGANKLEITELPVRTWTQSYKEQVLEPMVHGTEKTKPLIVIIEVSPILESSVSSV
ncbi:DNA topoisomerase 2-alpha-like [Tachypleus tridentatus]|uniref:DNA topoisomerase 2-alpha-like n=1 Tax=Tachypleus tridentatus TaxID=6853 RepID=UPI003FD58C8F